MTSEYIRRMMTYDPKTGLFTGLYQTLISHVTKRGYVIIRIDKKSYLAHRLAYLYMTSEFPKNQIDHINGIPNDNRWENLRPATHSENMRNRKKHVTNSSGFVGVCRYKKSQKWRAEIRVNGKKFHLGIFRTAEEGAAAYQGAASLLYGQWHRKNQ